MAINKKSLIAKGSAKNSTSSKTSAAKGSTPVTPGKMVPTMKLARAASINTTRAVGAGMKTTRSVNVV
jgi:hypothetical protein